MDPGSGSLELPSDGSEPEGPPPGAPAPDLGLPAEPLTPPDLAPGSSHHVVVGPNDADLASDPDAGSSPTLIRDPVDIEPRDAIADLGSSPTLIRDPLDMERPDPEPSLLRRWLPYLVAVGLIVALVFTCGAVQ
jgi:hypothetical protein